MAIAISFRCPKCAAESFGTAVLFGKAVRYCAGSCPKPQLDDPAQLEALRTTPWAADPWPGFWPVSEDWRFLRVGSMICDDPGQWFEMIAAMQASPVEAIQAELVKVAIPELPPVELEPEIAAPVPAQRFRRNAFERGDRFVGSRGGSERRPEIVTARALAIVPVAPAQRFRRSAIDRGGRFVPGGDDPGLALPLRAAKVGPQIDPVAAAKRFHRQAIKPQAVATSTSDAGAVAGSSRDAGPREVAVSGAASSPARR